MFKRKIMLPTLALAVIAVAIANVAHSASASAHKSRHHQLATAADANSAILNTFAVLHKTGAAGGAKVQEQYPVWVEAQEGNLCLIKNGVVEPGMMSRACGTDEEALEGKLISHATTPSGTSVTVGLAPNGDTSVTAIEADGSSRTVSVKENIYEIVGNAPLTIALNNASGQATTAGVPGT
jgi:hypothetical protein